MPQLNARTSTAAVIRYVAQIESESGWGPEYEISSTQSITVTAGLTVKVTGQVEDRETYSGAVTWTWSGTAPTGIESGTNTVEFIMPSGDVTAIGTPVFRKNTVTLSLNGGTASTVPEGWVLDSVAGTFSKQFDYQTTYLEVGDDFDSDITITPPTGYEDYVWTTNGWSEVGRGTLTMEAGWKFTVTVDLGDGVMPSVPEGWIYSSEYGTYSKDYSTGASMDSVTAIFNSAYLDGFFVDGWDVDPEDSVVYGMLYNDTTLTAIWGNGVDDSVFCVILDPNGGSFASSVKKYYYSGDTTAMKWTQTVLLPIRDSGSDRLVNPPNSDLELSHWACVSPYTEYTNETVIGGGYWSISVTLERSNYDSIQRMILYPVWSRKAGTLDHACAWLMMNGGDDSGKMQTTLDLGQIQTVTETYTPEITQIPLMTYSSEAAFVFDISVQKSISLDIIRTQPDDPDNDSTDSTQWTNRYWLTKLKSYADRWQMATDGCKFYLSVPDTERGWINEEMSDMFIEYEGVTCYLDSISMDFTNDTPKSIRLTLPVSLGTMNPKKETVSTQEMLMTQNEPGSATSTEPIGKTLAQMAVKVVTELVPFTVPQYLWSNLPRTEIIDDVLRYITFDRWTVLDEDEQSLGDRLPGDVMEPSELVGVSGLVTKYNITSVDDMAYGHTVGSDENNYVYLTPVDASSGSTVFTVTLVGGGGGGGGGAYEKEYGTDILPTYGYCGGNGGNSGGFRVFTLTLPNVVRTEGVSTASKFRISVGKGGKGAAQDGDGKSGGTTIMYQPDGGIYDAAGGAGGLCRKHGGSSDMGFSKGGLGGASGSSHNEIIGSVTDYSTVNIPIISRMGSFGEDNNTDTYTDSGGRQYFFEDDEGHFITYTGMANCSTSGHDVGTANQTLEVISDRGIYPQFLSQQAGASAITAGYAAYPVYESGYEQIIGIQIKVKEEYFCNGGGGGAPYRPPAASTWLGSIPRGGNGATLYRDVSGTRHTTGEVTGYNSSQAGTFGGGGGGGSGYAYSRSGADGGDGYILITADQSTAQIRFAKE